MTNQNFLTAVHEAGHAIARLVNHPGPHIRYMSLVDQPDGQLGMTAYGDRWMSCVTYPPEVLHSAREAARLDVIEALAGQVAERWQAWRDWDAVDCEGFSLGASCFQLDVEAGSDWEVIRARLEWLHPEETEDHFHPYWCEAIELVRQHWHAIDALGRLLLDRGRIEGEEIYQWWEDRQKLAA